ncbi:hypothetical protein B4U80_14647 [Leptotrombidium deliense]|uniref:Uncharacterized protein n=1 Tax=Leptotrombidium deliense TaxID=299467 RepID=A0A443RSM5_9ACAR|nr:hypothetical protein B4U80_14647 [Leptotrombidium deliense]
MHDRYHHIEAFQEQVYKESIRYTAFKEDFSRAWFNPKNSDIFDLLKRKFETVGLLMYDIKHQFVKPLDYFNYATYLYDQLKASEWLTDVPVNERLYTREFRQNLSEKFGTSRLSLTCVADDTTKLHYLNEIRVCYSRINLTAIPCPINVKFARDKEYTGPKQFDCLQSFNIFQ